MHCQTDGNINLDKLKLTRAASIFDTRVSKSKQSTLVLASLGLAIRSSVQSELDFLSKMRLFNELLTSKILNVYNFFTAAHFKRAELLL